ncbi:hypothetical protein CDL15_Pgr014475 [Punica granatum]|uniref:Uncharacterized protein n=1 Tax=Punica granatum TaxID=22663 RepID=A0A218WFG4_PUNGR|nr:hypothetical protein CDL15_Pgr014475 [Punica granatum]
MSRGESIFAKQREGIFELVFFFLLIAKAHHWLPAVGCAGSTCALARRTCVVPPCRGANAGVDGDDKD